MNDDSESLQTKIIKMHCKTIQEQTVIIDRLKKQLNVAVEALEFYSKEMNYSIDDYKGISGEMIKRCILYSDCEERNDIYSYAGLKARKTLQKIKSMEGGEWKTKDIS